MKKKIGIAFLSLVMSFVACGCSETNVDGPEDNSSENNSNEKGIDPEVLKYYENDKYVIGKKIKDWYHMSDPELPAGEIEFPELPTVTFVNDRGLCAKIGNKTINHLNTAYIADVNQDGHFDICYEVENKWRATYSEHEFDRIYVYDVYNNVLLNVFDSITSYAKDEKSYYFDLDENNVLCIVEGNSNMSDHYNIDFNRMARLLKDNKETYFEWFSPDYKILDIGLWAVENDEHIAPEIIVEIFGFVKKDVEFPFKAEDIVLEKISGGDFDVSIEASETRRGRFDLWLDFYDDDDNDYQFKITAGSFSNTVRIHYYAVPLCRTTDLYKHDTENNYWITYWTQINFAYNSYLIKDSKDNLISYFGINDTGNINIKSEDEFNAFKAKISSLEENEKVAYKFDETYPNVDFANYYVVTSMFYRQGNKLDFEINYIGQIDCDFTQNIYGYYNDTEEPSDSDCGVIITYLILPKNRRTYTVESTITYKTISSNVGFEKPIIYFYPEKEMDLSVSYVNEENLMTTYPKYNAGWNIHLNKNGTFTTDDSDREYYALYFDEHGNYVSSFEEGFYVTKENAISFLEEKMDYIGYTNREVDEFIMYWLPILEKNGQSLVYFEQTEQRNEECPLEFSTNPDTLIRTIIHIKKVDEKVNIPEQQLKHYDRSGFVVTEWGGVEY